MQFLLDEEKDYLLCSSSSCQFLTVDNDNRLITNFCKAFQIKLQKKYIQLGIIHQDEGQVLEVFHYKFR